MTGKQLRKAVTYLMRDEAILLKDEHCENFQFSKGFLCEYDCSSHSLMQLKMNDREVKDEEYLMSYDFIKLDGVPRLVIHDGGEKE